MTILKNRLSEQFTGRIGNAVAYMLDGKLVKRRIGKNLKPATVPQLASRQVTSITSSFLSPLKSFIQIGFKLEAKRKLSKSYQAASSYNRVNAISGIYPDQYINFEKVLLTKGNMPAALDVTVEKDENDLVFSWNNDSHLRGIEDSDQVMLMAYLPDDNDAIYLLNATQRRKGIARLTIAQRNVPLIVETYISFVSKNHKSIADSIYTGQFSM